MAAGGRCALKARQPNFLSINLGQPYASEQCHSFPTRHIRRVPCPKEDQMPYDWSGAQMRRTRLLRMTAAGTLLLLVIGASLLIR